MAQVQSTLYESSLASLPLIGRGKVRDIYAVGADHLLIVTTDRLSAFDVVLGEPIPGKGAVLTELSNFWFRHFKDVPNHLSNLKLDDVLGDPAERAQVAGRSMIVKKLKPFPVEAIVRGYLIGSGWKDYRKTGAVCGIALPTGLEQAAKLPAAIFTPSTKAEIGEHDENIDFDRSVALMGREYAERVRDLAVRIYTEAAAFALTKGLVIADTKFEFGTDAAGNVVLIDEVLTPDSSRFWPLAEYRLGTSPPSFDKQFVRDYLETLDWDKRPPAPKLPQEIVERTAAKYREALERLTG